MSTTTDTDRFTDGYNAARYYYGPGATRTLADIHTAVKQVQEEHPDGPVFYTDLLDLLECRTREWAQP